MLKIHAFAPNQPPPIQEGTVLSPSRWAHKWLAIFLIVHFVVWTVVPMFRGVPHADSLEAVIWGEYGGWGTDKHPPVSGWIAYGLFRLIGNIDLSVYLASQLCVLVAFIFFYKIAREYLPPDKAFLSVLFLEGIRYYNYYSTIFNVNVVSLMFVPIIVYLFHRAVKTDAMPYWSGLGVFGGLALLTKYSNNTLLFCLGLFLVCTREGRIKMRRPGPYVALLVAILIFLPHCIWLYHRNFSSLTYAATVLTRQYTEWGAWLVGTLQKLNLELWSFAGTLMVFLGTYLGLAKTARRRRGKIDSLLIFAGVLPYAITIAIIIFNRIVVHSQWGFSLLGFLPLLLLLRFPFDLTPSLRRRALFLGFFAMLFFAGLHFTFSATKASPSFNLDRTEYANFIRAEWEKISPKPLAYVGGTWEYRGYASLFMHERPQVFYPGRSAIWIDKSDVEKKGLIVLSSYPDTYQVYKNTFPTMIDKGELMLPVRNWRGKTKLHRIIYGVVPPRSQEKPDA